MGLLSKIIAAKATAAVVKKLNAKARDPLPRGQTYIPAGQAAPVNRYGSSGITTKAADFYRQNPKMVASVGVAVAALVLQQLTRGKRLF